MDMEIGDLVMLKPGRGSQGGLHQKQRCKVIKIEGRELTVMRASDRKRFFPLRPRELVHCSKAHGRTAKERRARKAHRSDVQARKRKEAREKAKAAATQRHLSKVGATARHKLHAAVHILEEGGEVLGTVRTQHRLVREEEERKEREKQEIAALHKKAQDLAALLNEKLNVEDKAGEAARKEWLRRREMDHAREAATHDMTVEAHMARVARRAASRIGPLGNKAIDKIFAEVDKDEAALLALYTGDSQTIIREHVKDLKAHNVGLKVNGHFFNGHAENGNRNHGARGMPPAKQQQKQRSMKPSGFGSSGATGRVPRKQRRLSKSPTTKVMTEADNKLWHDINDAIIRDTRRQVAKVKAVFDPSAPPAPPSSTGPPPGALSPRPAGLPRRRTSRSPSPRRGSVVDHDKAVLHLLSELKE